jgi:hypothetical protein
MSTSQQIYAMVLHSGIGFVSIGQKTSTSYVWPVRGGN